MLFNLSKSSRVCKFLKRSIERCKRYIFTKIENVIKKFATKDLFVKIIAYMSTDTQNKKIVIDVLHAPDPKVDPKEYSLDSTILKFIGNEVFLGTFLCSMVLLPDWRCDTAYIKISEHGRLVLSWNPDFMRRQSEKRKINIIRHEVLHAILLHITKRKPANKAKAQLANIAMDLAINSIICAPGLVDTKASKEVLGQFLPEECCLPGVVDPELFEKAPNFANWLLNAPQLQTFEFYMKKMLDVVSENETTSLLEFMSMGNHNEWETPKEIQDVVKEYIRQAIAKGAMKATLQNNWGNVPVEIQKQILEYLSKQVDWRTLLRNFVGRARKNAYETSYKKLNKKIPYLLPGRKHETIGRIACFIDQSGSVSDTQIGFFIGELINCAKETDICCYNFDATVDDSSRLIINFRTKPTWARTREGGTDFNSIANWLEQPENINKFDAIVILTDGFGDPLKEIKQQVLWILTQDGNEKIVRSGDLFAKLTETIEDDEN
jgi:predicted metal-dependent peptidase